MESGLGAGNKHLEHISLNDDFIKQAEKTNHVSHNHLSGYTLHGSYSNQHTHSHAPQNHNLDLKSTFTSRFNNSFSNLTNIFGLRNKTHHHARHINGGNQNIGKSSSTITDSIKTNKRSELEGQIPKKSIYILSFSLSAMLAWLVAIYLIRHNEHKDLNRNEWATYMVGSKSDQQQMNQQTEKSFDQPITINSRQTSTLSQIQPSLNPYAFPLANNSNIPYTNNNLSPTLGTTQSVNLPNPNMPPVTSSYYNPNTSPMPVQSGNGIGGPPMPPSASNSCYNPNQQQFGVSTYQMYSPNTIEQASFPQSRPVSQAPKARHRVIVTR